MYLCFNQYLQSIIHDTFLTCTIIGGLAYECLQYLIEPSSVAITPLSTLAKPLKISISVGSFSSSDSLEKNRYGLQCSIECSTFFNLKSVEIIPDNIILQKNIAKEETKVIDTIVQQVYENEICIDVNPCLKYSIKSISNMTGKLPHCGKITMHLHHPAIDEETRHV